METILIKPNLLKLVINGQKVTTCRHGVRTYPLEKTRLQSNSSEDYIYININELKYYKLKNITNDMAQDDGFDNRENLIEVLEQIYDGINDDSDITIVCFTLIQ